MATFEEFFVGESDLDVIEMACVHRLLVFVNVLEQLDLIVAR